MIDINLSFWGLKLEDLTAASGDAGGVEAKCGLGCEGGRTSLEVGELEVRSVGKNGLAVSGLVTWMRISSEELRGSGRTTI
jgi:hypothetical protein